MSFDLNHAHPLVVHFPIALLLIAPLFVLLALLIRKLTLGFAASALILLALGTAGAWVAVSTGDAAEDAARTTTAMKAVLKQHEELAEAAAVTFTILTAVVAAVVLLPRFLKKLDRPAWTRAALAACLALLLGGDLLVVKAAHEGGRLVHEFQIDASAVGHSPAFTRR